MDYQPFGPEYTTPYTNNNITMCMPKVQAPSPIHFTMLHSVGQTNTPYSQWYGRLLACIDNGQCCRSVQNCTSRSHPCPNSRPRLGHILHSKCLASGNRTESINKLMPCCIYDNVMKELSTHTSWPSFWWL